MPTRSSSVVSEKPKRVDLELRRPLPPPLPPPPLLVPVPAEPWPGVVVGAVSLAGAVGAKVGTVVGVERARISVLLSVSVGVVSAMAGAESSGGASSVEGGAEDSGPESAESTFSLLNMARGFPPLKMTMLPRPRRARRWTAMAMRKGVEVRRAVRASHFFF